jgi:tetratricopeptide (TPR) repeat protein
MRRRSARAPMPIEAIGQARQGRVTRWQSAAIVLLAVVAGAVSWMLIRLHQHELVAQALAALKPERIRTELEKSIRENYDRDAAGARTLGEGKQRQHALRDAAQARDQKLAHLDDVPGSISRTIASGDYSPEFLELTQLLQEQGIDAALTYLSQQESRLLGPENRWLTMRQREIRRTLAPFLAGVRLHRVRGDLAEAERLCTKLLAADADWAEARELHVATLLVRGERALSDERPTMAWQRFTSARISAERLVQLDPVNAAWQRDLWLSNDRLAGVVKKTDHNAARDLYIENIEIAKKRAATDSADLQAQHDLMTSYLGMSHFSRANYYQQALAIAKELAAADPASTEAQRELAAMYEYMGSVSVWPHAREFYEQSLAIRNRLAAADPANVQAQRDLSVIYESLGSANQWAGHFDAALKFHRQSLEIRKKLATADPTETQTQRDLLASYSGLGDVNQKMRRFDAARDDYQQGLDIAQKLAAADPADAQAEHNLSDSYFKLAQLYSGAKDFERAIQNYERQISVLKRMIGKGQRQDEAKQHLLQSQEWLANCRQSQIAVGAWDELRKQPADKQPGLLSLRCHLLATRRDIDGVAQAAEALAKLEPQTPASSYNAACGYGLCAKLAAGWPGLGPFPPPAGAAVPKTVDEKNRQKYVRAAIDQLQAAAKARYRPCSWMQSDSNLDALHELPEFKKLVAAANSPVANSPAAHSPIH